MNFDELLQLPSVVDPSMLQVGSICLAKGAGDDSASCLVLITDLHPDLRVAETAMVSVTPDVVTDEDLVLPADRMARLPFDCVVHPAIVSAVTYDQIGKAIGDVGPEVFDRLMERSYRGCGPAGTEEGDIERFDQLVARCHDLGRSALTELWDEDVERPAGTATVAVGPLEVIVDALSLEVLDGDPAVDDLDLQGPPGAPSASAAANAIGQIAAATLATADTDGVARALLVLQQAAALADPSLDAAVGDLARAAAWREAREALDGAVQSDRHRQELGAALARFRSGAIGRIGAADALGLVTSILAAAERSGSDAVHSSVRHHEEAGVDRRGTFSDLRVANPSGSAPGTGVEAAERRGRRAAVLTRRGLRANAAWLLAASAWDEVDAGAARACRALGGSEDPEGAPVERLEDQRIPRVWTWDAVRFAEDDPR